MRTHDPSADNSAAGKPSLVTATKPSERHHMRVLLQRVARAGPRRRTRGGSVGRGFVCSSAHPHGRRGTGCLDGDKIVGLRVFPDADDR
jgi:hypothetical protein